MVELMKRNRKNRKDKSAGTGPVSPSQTSPRTGGRAKRRLAIFIAILALIILGAGYYWWSLRYPHVFPNDSAALVFESPSEGSTKRVLIWKSMHEGKSSLEHLVNDDEKLKNYLDHQAFLHRKQVELFEEHGPARFRCLIEDLAGEGEVHIAEFRGNKEVERAVALLAKSLERSASDPAEFARIRQTAQVTGDKFLALTCAQTRFTLYLAQSKTKGAEKALYGADIPGYVPLSSIMHKKLDSLMLRDGELGEADAREFRDWLKAAIIEDHTKRHAYIAKLIKEMPEGSVCSIIIGGFHCRSGNHGNVRPPEFPLEDAILQAERVHLQVWEDSRYAKMNFGIQLISSDSSVREVKDWLVEMKRAKTKAKK